MLQPYIHDTDATNRNEIMIAGMCYTTVYDVEQVEKLVDGADTMDTGTTNVLWCLPLDTVVWPYEFTKVVKKYNISRFENEEKMLQYFFNQIRDIDPDIVMSHG
uniref:DNA polymerase alpha catalytic subunit n=1 Tax=Lygus hesperus TaxID=30085 RepID=A0A0A9Z586_LYGHE